MYYIIIILTIVFSVQINGALLVKFNRTNIPKELIENTHFEVKYTIGSEPQEHLVVLPFGEHELSNSNIVIVNSIDAVYGYRMHLQKKRPIKNIVNAWHRSYFPGTVSNISDLVSDYIFRPLKINILNDKIFY